MRGITKSFGGLRALDEVDLTLCAGEIHGVLGENGAGKSTLMYVLSGMLRPDAGRIIVAGQPLRLGSPNDSAKQGIGMVHQHFSLVPALSVAENLSLAAAAGPAFFRRSGDLAAGALAVAERLGWRFDPNTAAWQLPIGRQQRLEILKVLQRDARWLLFDEPTAVLSPPEAEELFEVLQRLRREGRGIVFISHKLPEVLRLCDRVTVLRRGRRIGERPRGVTAAELARLMVGGSSSEDRSNGKTPRESAKGAKARRIRMGTRKAPGRARTRFSLSLPLSRFRSLRAFAAKEMSGGRPPREVERETALAEALPPALAVRDLWVRDSRGLGAVRGLSMEVRHGEIFGIAGVDGNGQTELAEAIVGLRPVLAGEVTLSANPHRSNRDPHRQRPGYIPEDRRRSGLVLPLSVRENLALEIYAAPPFRWGPVMRLDHLWSTTRAMARRFDVRVADERQPAATLSGGNQQKIVVARALSGERSLLVTVNPTRGLDIGATQYVHEQLRAARAAGVGVLLISTDLDEVLDLSDREGVLYEGRLQGIVAPTEPRERIGQMMGGAGETMA
jgi:simple sugar transport system ATP-binding protein